MLWHRADESATEKRNIMGLQSTRDHEASSSSLSENTSLNHRGHRNGEALVSKFTDPETKSNFNVFSTFYRVNITSKLRVKSLIICID